MWDLQIGKLIRHIYFLYLYLEKIAGEGQNEPPAGNMTQGQG
jgi:hypothetical protein